jgi:hypothetical protein
MRIFRSVTGFADGTTHIEHWPDGSVHIICPELGGDVGDCGWTLEEILYRVDTQVWEEVK